MKKNKIYAVLFFVLLAIFRLSLISKGHRFDVDEERYLNALYVWIELFQGHFSQAIAYLFNALGRPCFVLVSLIPAGCQLALAHFKIFSLTNLHFYDIPSFFNAVVTIINSILFFRILILLVSDEMIALGGTIAYSLLVNTNLYIRHLFPYDYSLLLFFIALLLILRDVTNKQSRPRTAVICGILSAFGFLIYPGYYAAALVMMFFFVVSVRSNFLLTISYVSCFLATVMSFEVMSNAVGLSYLKELSVWALAVNHGSFSEGFLFIVRYIKEVEGGIGVLLFILFVLYVFYFMVKDSTVFKWLIVAVIFMYLLSAILGFVFCQTVFYGRTLHMYFPFLVLAAARAISLIPQQIGKKFLITILILCSFCSFIPFAYTYSRLSYPGDLFFKYLSHIPLNKIFWISADEKLIPNNGKEYSVVLVNFEPYDAFGYESPSLPSNMVLGIMAPHPLNFSAYIFENYSPLERKLIKKHHYQMQIYWDARIGNKINKEGLGADKGSFYRAFNPRLPFIYTTHWLSEYIYSEFYIQNGRLGVFFPERQILDDPTGSKFTR